MNLITKSLIEGLKIHFKSNTFNNFNCYFIYNIFNYFKKLLCTDNAVSKIIFIGLASLTFPHILLEYLLEKNEKK